MDAWAAGPGGQGATQGRSGAGSRSGAGAPSPGDGDVGPGDDALAAFADDGAPLVYEERVLGGARADEALPLVVAVHGLGDSPGGIARLFDGARARVRVVLPRAPVRYGPGWAWFPYRAGASSPDALARGVALAARRLARTIALVARERPTVGAPALCGFSQGGMLSYAVAVLHGGTVSRAMPLAGFLPAPLVPSGDRAPRRPPRVALRARHGDADRVVPIERDRETVRALAALGYDVTLVEEPGVGHVVSDAMTAALHAWLAEVEADAAPTARPLRPAR
jgi:phospholipase/carboxylesterase